ncbi:MULTISPECIES: enoyl-CoA hydratase-related protein [unclassified Rhodococcus (in: high G+C Gram-positive bacteria)]|uniref:enoyl-CoA hydratase-related protein n=1 Tax=unclassified Rhodococcus (in: high G+C Gram-positive bacteria) TaxID=192944 RepID=UPI000A0D85EE|nr:MULTISPECIES: enoyl-CoA hydratase-related protein [unclassified Rhodococcus (in: high G+C Gram-positive bacteria)]MDJ0360018.1 enoyl-CoA hydratase-related protein [Rhodococcus sp. H29-C3]ORI24419.1 enoyl-CoA hydratase [Rhodococcus sp. 1168]
MANFDTLTLTVDDDGIAQLTLDRPEALNALNSAMMTEFSKALREATRSGARVLVLTGNGRAFAAGADIAEMRDQTFGSMNDANHLALWEGLADLPIPTIGAVNGFALGGGCEIAMMCDILIAGASASFGQPEIALGIIPGIGGTQRLTRIVGKAQAMDLILTGRRIDADEAHRIGLISRVVPDDEVVEQARVIARQIAGFSPRAARAAKECVLRADQTSLAEGLLFERRWFHSLFAFSDQTEGMTAFLEKRPARFLDA